MSPLLVALGTTVVVTLPGFLTGALGVELRADLGMSLRDLGVSVSVYFTAAAVSSMALGHLGHRLGARRSIRLAAAMTCLSSLGIAVVVDSRPGLFVALAVAGAATALAQPAINAVLAQQVASDRLGLAFGAKQSAIPVAVLVSGISIPSLALTVGWRAVFGVSSAAALAVALFIARGSGDAGAPQRRGARTDTGLGLLSALALGAGLAGMGGNALGTFTVSAGVAAGRTQATAGLILAAGSLASVVMRLVAGHWVDRRRSQGLRPLIGLMIVGSFGFLALSSGIPWLFVPGTLVAFGGGWGWPGLFQFAVVSRNRATPAVATGITQTGIYVGAAVGPALGGAVAEASYGAAWLLMAATTASGALVIALVRRRMHTRQANLMAVAAGD